MTARMENVATDDGTGSKYHRDDGTGDKTYLTDDEHWVCWESGDSVKMCPGTGTNNTLTFPVTGGTGTTLALLSRDDIDRDAYSNFFGSPVYFFSPENLSPEAANGARTSWTITLPQTQPYRTSSNPAANPDHSFSPKVMPMVAYSAAGISAPFQYFHPVCGILRLQFYSSSSTAVTIESILIEAKDKISGTFTLPETNHLGTPAIQDPEPYIMPVTTPAPSRNDSTITITGINKTVGGTNHDLYTFYIPLPSTKDLTAGISDPDDFYNTYKLRITVRGKRTSDNANVQCQKILQAKIHRCNITKMRALDLEAFVASGTGNSSVQLVGNGTYNRPFQIYTYADLEKVRDAFNNAADAKSDPVINGQTVKGVGETGGPTYFKICRSDIEIPSGGVRNTGIKGFKGYMFTETSSANRGIITNNSGNPLFESISSGGKVENIYMSGGVTVAAIDDFSPFCYENGGTILNCHNNCNVTVDVPNSGSHDMHIAGLCAINHGTINGGANSGDLRSDSSNVAGVCYLNDGTISGSFTMSYAMPRGKNIAGVCFNNASGGTVSECIVSSSINPVTSSGNVGVIVFENHGTVSNCRAAGTLQYSITGSVGGICNTNYGTVKNCSNTVSLTGCRTSVGGIVAVNECGDVYNCDNEGDHFIDGAIGSATATYAGGIVGWLKGGTVKNCFNQCIVSGATNSGGIVGKIEMAAAENDPAVRPVQNCWSGGGQRLHGYIYDTICKVSYACFSSNSGESTTVCGCNLFNETTYNITYMQPNSNQPSYLQSITISTTLLDALNTWVTNNNSGGGYWSWTVPAGDLMPRLSAGSKRGMMKRRR